MSTKQRDLDYQHWSADWLDVTELQAGYEVVFAAEHREREAFVSLVPVVSEDTGSMDASTDLGREYRRIVRPRQGAPAVSEHTTTYSGASKSEAIDRTHEWLEDNPDGLTHDTQEAVIDG